MSKGSSGQHGQLCERDSMGSCVRGTPREDPRMSKGFSKQHGQLGILDPPKTERTRLDCLRSLGQL